jgi:hypothetical protein
MIRRRTNYIPPAMLVLLTLLSARGAALADEPAPLRTEFVFEARVKVDRPMVIGQSSHGLRRVVLNRTLIITDVERTPDSAIVRFYKVN